MNIHDIPCNVHPHRDADVTLLLPRRGLVRVRFGADDNITDDDRGRSDEHGTRIDMCVYVSEYAKPPEEDNWSNALVFAETDGGQMLYSSKTYRSGDIRDLLKPALEFVGWPTDVSKYSLVGVSGQFYKRRQRPKGRCTATERKRR